MENYKKWSTVCMICVGKGFFEAALFSGAHKGECLSVPRSPCPVSVALYLYFYVTHITVDVSQNNSAAVDS